MKSKPLFILFCNEFPVWVKFTILLKDVYKRQDLGGFRRLLGNGSDYGVRITDAEQPSPDGLAQAFLIGADFIGNDSVCLVLGEDVYKRQ